MYYDGFVIMDSISLVKSFHPNVTVYQPKSYLPRLMPMLTLPIHLTQPTSDPSPPPYIFIQISNYTLIQLSCLIQPRIQLKCLIRIQFGCVIQIFNSNL